MRILKPSLVAAALCASIAMPTFAGDETVPSGTFVDEYGTSFEFQPCGAGTALCAVLTNLEGASATEDNLAFVGKQVIEAEQIAPNAWKGSLAAGGMSADATITQIDPNTVTIQGCRAAILCKTLSYNKAS
ncbi:hypothetical protein PSC71_05375 [Devosia sp. J2-20]|uniref:hypothetical protein n=1 Tax=Devosia sp. J2-20 TaxID=3026161 RepID=UPI00249B0C95|nr:hypothetical protein [Devosia sp. J2-20]WDR00213.1 hypothetical protein PSC71_05375 [Devosia sp. J2-20]